MDKDFIGDIKYSILEPAIFKAEHPGWDLLAGQTLSTGTPLGQLGITQLPDARGMFLRGMNMERNDAFADPDANSRNIVTPQPNAVKNHQHLLSSSKGVMRFVEGGNLKGGVSAAFMNVIGVPEKGGGALLQTDNDGGIASETRPNNIAVYIYIKLS